MVELALHAEHHTLEVGVCGVGAPVRVGLFPACISPAYGRHAGTLLGACRGMEVLRWHTQEIGKDYQHLR